MPYNRCFSASDTDGLALDATECKRLRVMTTVIFPGLSLSALSKMSWTAASCASERRAWRSAPLNPSVILAMASRSMSLANGNCKFSITKLVASLPEKFLYFYISVFYIFLSNFYRVSGPYRCYTITITYMIRLTNFPSANNLLSRIGMKKNVWSFHVHEFCYIAGKLTGHVNIIEIKWQFRIY